MSNPPFIPPARPQTPQALLHRMPDKPDPSAVALSKPSKYVILIMGSTGVAGKVQTATEVSNALSCPLFQGESLHESSAKAASVGASRRAGANEEVAAAGPNEGRYQRMWLSKMTRTGLLFPDESRPATEGFSGFGGSASTATSRRGSASSVGSAVSMSSSAAASNAPSVLSTTMKSGAWTAPHTEKPVFTLSEKERQRRANPALLVTTHPNLEQWHRDAIRTALSDYGIGIIFVPLYEDDDLPVLKPLDPKTMTSFGSFASFGGASKTPVASLEEEMVLRVDTEADVENLIREIVDGTRDIMGIEA